MARLTGDWKPRGGDGGKYPKTVQVLLGIIVPELDEYCKNRNTNRAEALREMWERLLNRAIEITPIPLEKGDKNEDGVVTVPVTTEMFEEIEMFRGNIPRASVLRALTVRGLREIPEISHKDTGKIPEKESESLATKRSNPFAFLDS
jgi:hypothetical protein